MNKQQTPVAGRRFGSFSLVLEPERLLEPAAVGAHGHVVLLVRVEELPHRHTEARVLLLHLVRGRVGVRGKVRVKAGVEVGLGLELG